MLNHDYTDFKQRSKQIKQEISESNADLICIQEVDHYETVYKPFFKSLGYEFYTEWREQNDCCLVGFKTEKFELVDKLGI